MIKKLLHSLREYKTAAILTMLVMTGEVVMETLIPFKMADLIDIGFGEGNLSYIIKTGLLLILFALGSFLFGVLGSLIGAKAGTGFTNYTPTVSVLLSGVGISAYILSSGSRMSESIHSRTSLLLAYSTALSASIFSSISSGVYMT